MLCVVFHYQKNFLIAPLINKLVFKKLIPQFRNYCFIIFFIKFVAMILLQILKSIKKFLVSIIILLSVKKEVISNTIDKFISNNVKGIGSSEKRWKIFEYLKNNIRHNGFVFLQETHSLTQDEKMWKDDIKGKSLQFEMKKEKKKKKKKWRRFKFGI